MARAAAAMKCRFEGLWPRRELLPHEKVDSTRWMAGPVLLLGSFEDRSDDGSDTTNL